VAADKTPVSVGTSVSQLEVSRERRLAEGATAVLCREVSKEFRLPHQRYSTLKERALHPFAARSHDTFRALEGVSLEVKQGEFYGIVGRNGSGKSTLLKCLAGIYAVDRGSIQIEGRLSPFIELGVGFNPELTARDNVLINAILLGLSRREARRRFDEIIEFAELEEFVDLKLKNYSSGMSVRLGFSVAIQVDAAVILVDEVLAVGDAAFQRKCFDEFERMRADGRTILFVTHDMNSIQRFCDRAMLLERGRVLEAGQPDEIARLYNEVNFGQVAAEADDDEHRGSREARVRAAWCETPSGERIVAAAQGETCVACLEVEFLRPVERAMFAMTFRNDIRHTVFVAHSGGSVESASYAPGDRATVRFSFENLLGPSRYTLTPSVGVWEPRYRVLDQLEDAASLIVDAPVISGGVADLPTEVEIERT
jgi:ABC-type polysaccharide/polyol phosphate transport system ATPase subunit